MMNVFFLGRGEERGIEDLLFDLRVHFQGHADLLREIGLLRVRARFLELLEPVLDLAVIRLQELDRIHRSCCSTFTLFSTGHGLFSFTWPTVWCFSISGCTGAPRDST